MVLSERNKQHLSSLMKEKIIALAGQIHNDVVSWRRKIHANPELAYAEVQTAAFVAEHLRSLGLDVTTEVAKTGVIGLLKCNNSESKCVALRADMDALPILEANAVDYCSKNEGVMHACGHDVHTANLLGVASVLSELRNELSGTFKFIFQPSEEKIPSGADAMIKAGALENPKPACMLGLHVSPEIEVGKIGFHAGKFMASSDEIYITVIGKGGHAAQLHNTVNPLFAASEVLLELQKVSDAKKPVVLNFGKIEGLGATNVVPEKVEIAGTLRCFDEQLRFELHKFIKDEAAKAALRHNAKCEVNILQGYPVLVNDHETTAAAKLAAADILGEEAAIDVPQRMGSEDFAYYTHHVPACFFRLGVGNAAKGITSAIHTPTFNIDEDALKHSVAAMSWMAVKLMQE